MCRYSEVLQRAELKRHVLALAYGYAAALTYAVTCVGDMRNPGATPLTSPLLAPINLLLQWLATTPDCVRCVPVYSLCAIRQHATCGSLHAWHRASLIQLHVPSLSSIVSSENSDVGIGRQGLGLSTCGCGSVIPSRLSPKEHLKSGSICRPDDMDEAEAKERTALWRALAKVLLLLPPPLAGASATALPEDWQLCAFAPLNAAHSRLNFHQAPSDEVGLFCLPFAIPPFSAHA